MCRMRPCTTNRQSIVAPRGALALIEMNESYINSENRHESILKTQENKHKSILKSLAVTLTLALHYCCFFDLRAARIKLSSSAGA
jgi:hypothetical protein